MPARALLTVILTACGGGASTAPEPPPPKIVHNEELTGLMKTEVNQPFSALMFLVFHAAEQSPGATDLDYAKIAVPANTLRAGILKLRASSDPPVLTSEARAVFFTYVDAMVRDSSALTEALVRRDRSRTEGLLSKISETCSDCHHFFRLKDIEQGPPPR